MYHSYLEISCFSISETVTTKVTENYCTSNLQLFLMEQDCNATCISIFTLGLHNIDDAINIDSTLPTGERLSWGG